VVSISARCMPLSSYSLFNSGLDRIKGSQKVLSVAKLQGNNEISEDTPINDLVIVKRFFCLIVRV